VIDYGDHRTHPPPVFDDACTKQAGGSAALLPAIAERQGQFAFAQPCTFTIARDRFIDLSRRRPSKMDSKVYPIGVPADDCAERGCYLTQLEQHLRRAIASLASEQRQLFEHSYFRDRSQSALADEFDLPLGTLKSRQRLALGRLRRHLDPFR